MNVTRSDSVRIVLFCSSGLDPDEVEPDFAAEQTAAVASGYRTSLVDHEELTSGSATRGVIRVGKAETGTCGLYRGWMLSVERYESLYRVLQVRGITLINTPDAYRACHWLPESHARIAAWTPESLWIPTADLMREGQVNWDRVVSSAATFGTNALVVKDYVKSQKHDWQGACYVPRGDDAEAVRRVVSRFLELQGDDLAGGLVIRRYVSLRQIGRHQQSGMPLSEEYRIFFLDGRPIVAAPYWDLDAEVAGDLPMAELAAIVHDIPSRFFSMDVARDTDGRWWIIELGDGQVAGLPPRVDAAAFYTRFAGERGDETKLP